MAGSLSGPQVTGGDCKKPAYAQPNSEYTTSGGELTFTLPTAGATPFECGDSFVIVTTGFTAHSEAIWINEDGKINPGPRAKISADPLYGPPPLKVQFEAQSVDPDDGPMTHGWDFGDGNTGSGASIEHEFTRPAPSRWC